MTEPSKAEFERALRQAAIHPVNRELVGTGYRLAVGGRTETQASICATDTAGMPLLGTPVLLVPFDGEPADVLFSFDPGSDPELVEEYDLADPPAAYIL